MKLFGLIPILCALQVAVAAVPVTMDPAATPRERYGIAQLESTLASPGVQAPKQGRIVAAVRTSSLFAGYSGMPDFKASESEAFHLRRAGNDWLVIGSDPSGVLYGCLELARRAAASKALTRADRIHRSAGVSHPRHESVLDETG